MAESTGKWTFGPRDIPGGVQWTASSAEDIAACSALPAEVQAETLRASVSLGPYAWDVLVRAVRTPGASKVALFMHGHGWNCNWVCWTPYWRAIADQGYHLLAFDCPGYGRSSGFTNQTAKWKPYDHELVLLLLAGMGVPRASGCVTVFGQCMGGAMFLRALCADPETFAPFHVLHNCTIGTWPAALEGILTRKGGSIFVFWEADEDHRRDTNVYRNFSALAKERPELCKFHDLPYKYGAEAKEARYVGMGDGVDCGTGLSRSEQSELIGTGKSSYLLTPTPACLADVTAFVAQAPRATSAPAPPTESALQRGVKSRGFRVFVRVRPQLERELKAGVCLAVAPVAPPEGWEGLPPDEVRVKSRSWVFDRVFDPSTAQEEVYETVARPVIESVLGGSSGCVFAYGQTGSGKTFTMEGAAGAQGIIPRALAELLGGLPAESSCEVTYTQLYNDALLDLFDPTNPLSVADAGDGGALIQGATALADARDAAAVLARVREGSAFRATGATNMNDASSRSHALLSLTLSNPPRVVHLVDLAGSERVKRSKAEGDRLEEAIAINSSLLALGNVVSALVENDGKPRGHIPYRDSLLTRVLRPALGGTARTALVACVSPAADSESETCSTLAFAARASYIKNSLGDEEEPTELTEAEQEKIEGKGNVPVISDGMTMIPSCGVDVSCFADWSAGGASPLVVFLHHYGFGATGGHWSGLFDPVVSAGGRYLSPSFPGHGLTAGSSSSRCEDLGKPDGPVELLRGLLDWAGEAKAILVGWDWGAGIAAEFAIKYPKRTAQLCVYCMSYRDEARLGKLAKRGKNILFFWDKDDPNRSPKKGKAFAAAMQTKYREIDHTLMETKIQQWVQSS